MKKFIVFLIFFLFINVPSKEIMVFNESENTSYYELDFRNENLTLDNFKLKMATFTSYEYNIKKVYIDNSIKEYFSFDNTNINIGVEKLKKEYLNELKENYSYDKLDNGINMTRINKIELYCEEDALTIFRRKYPKVIIKRIEN